MKKLQIIFAILTASALLLFVISSSAIAYLSGLLDSQKAVERWVSDDTRYAQVSAFISPDAGVKSYSIERGMVSSLDAAMTEASISASKEGAKIYTYCYSSVETVIVSKINEETGMELKKTISAAATAVGGNYFLFHPEKLLSGYYFDPTDNVLNDFILIDDTLAWQFFGSPDVVGRRLQINGKTCYIAGVYKPDDVYSEFAGDSCRLYMSHSLFDDLTVTACEAVLPDPVSNFAVDTFKKCISVSEGEAAFVENSGRFTDRSLLNSLKNSSRKSVRNGTIAYPYVENTAVVLVDYATVWFVFKLIAMIIFAIVIVSELVIIYIKRKAIMSAIFDRFKKFLVNLRYNFTERKKKI